MSDLEGPPIEPLSKGDASLSHKSRKISWDQNEDVLELQRRIKYLEVDNELLRHRNIWLLDLEEENNSLREKNSWVTANKQIIEDFQCTEQWDKYWEEENDTLRKENSCIEKILSSLKDDRQGIKIISRLKRGESHQAIAEWLDQPLVGSDSQALSPTTEHQTSAEFEACPLAGLGDEEAQTEKSVHLRGTTDLDGDVGTSTQWKNTSTVTEQVASHYGCPSNQSPTNFPQQEQGSGITSGASTESDISEDNSSPSPENDAWLTIAYAKHRMMVSLMRDVYTNFNPQWRANLRSRTGSQSANTGLYSQSPSSHAPSSTARGKRRTEDRDSPPPDANKEKKRKTRSTRSGDGDQGRLFACFFYKYNSQKYCSNGETGTKYRSCAGPGFSKISQLKQHLKRNHRAPIHCPRCWLVVNSQADMASHANSDERCERREPQVPEGVDQDKMRMITETWGVSWDGIYEILFPGAPVPSPYYEADDLPLENLEPSPPASRELRDFENYNRTALPLLVEANLRAIVESQIAPIEERVRAMVVDIVRTCQLTVARNFHLTVAPTSSANDRAQPSSQAIHMYGQPAQVPMDGTPGSSLDFFPELPHLDLETSESLPANSQQEKITDHQNPDSESSYASLPCSCSCSCHDYSDSWNKANGRSSCQSCADRHSDEHDFDFGTLDNELDWVHFPDTNL